MKFNSLFLIVLVRCPAMRPFLKAGDGTVELPRVPIKCPRAIPVMQ